jgi:hypothetical protein
MLFLTEETIMPLKGLWGGKDLPDNPALCDHCGSTNSEKTTEGTEEDPWDIWKCKNCKNEWIRPL